MPKNDKTFYWTIGIIIFFLFIAPKIDFKEMFAVIPYAPDSLNLVYQTHSGLKLIDGGCIIEQKNLGVYGTFKTCSRWITDEQEKGYVDWRFNGAPFLWNVNGQGFVWVSEMTSLGGCSLKYYGGGLWTYLADVKLENGQLIREISDLYTYQNYDFSLPTKMNNISYIDQDWIMDGYCPLGITTNSEGTEFIDDCGSFGAVDPSPFNGIDEVKCDAYCRAGMSECIVRYTDGRNESQRCSLDGSVIIHELCYSGCQGGFCTSSPTITVPIMENYKYGDDINVTVRLLVGDTPYPYGFITGRIEVDGDLISETSNFTDNQGYAQLHFTNVEAIGPASLVAYTIIRSEEYMGSTNMFFSGVPLSFSSTSSSWIQSSIANITFLVEVLDDKFRPVDINLITNLKADTSLSNGVVFGNKVEYLGSGVYEVNSKVNGTGLFLGKITFDYQGEYFESPAITIDVESATIAVGTNLIPPTAVLDTEETLLVSFTSSLGTPLDPEEIIIRISWPSGYEEDILYLGDLRKVSEGMYEFDYLFNQVEKYSFDVYGSKEGFAAGNAKATVSVTGSSSSTYGPGPSWGFGNLELILYAAIALIILFVIIGSKRKGGTVQ